MEGWGFESRVTRALLFPGVFAMLDKSGTTVNGSFLILIHF